MTFNEFRELSIFNNADDWNVEVIDRDLNCVAVWDDGKVWGDWGKADQDRYFDALNDFIYEYGHHEVVDVEEHLGTYAITVWA